MAHRVVLKGALASKMLVCATLPTSILLCGTKPSNQVVGITWQTELKLTSVLVFWVEEVCGCMVGILKEMIFLDDDF